jgi:hypothetical protein
VSRVEEDVEQFSAGRGTERGQASPSRRSSSSGLLGRNLRGQIIVFASYAGAIPRFEARRTVFVCSATRSVRLVRCIQVVEAFQTAAR